MIDQNNRTTIASHNRSTKSRKNMKSVESLPEESSSQASSAKPKSNRKKPAKEGGDCSNPPEELSSRASSSRHKLDRKKPSKPTDSSRPRTEGSTRSSRSAASSSASSGQPHTKIRQRTPPNRGETKSLPYKSPVVQDNKIRQMKALKKGDTASLAEKSSSSRSRSSSLPKPSSRARSSSAKPGSRREMPSLEDSQLSSAKRRSKRNPLTDRGFTGLSLANGQPRRGKRPNNRPLDRGAKKLPPNHKRATPEMIPLIRRGRGPPARSPAESETGEKAADQAGTKLVAAEGWQI